MPESVGISLDKAGWAEVDELIRGLNAVGKTMTLVVSKRTIEGLLSGTPNGCLGSI